MGLDFLKLFGCVLGFYNRGVGLLNDCVLAMYWLCIGCVLGVLAVYWLGIGFL